MGMHKYLLSALLFLVSLGCSSQGNLDVVEPIENLKGTPATVWALETSGGSGTGVALSCEEQAYGMYEIIVLTAKHVVSGHGEDMEGFVIGYQEGKHNEIPGHVIQLHPTLDIAKILMFSKDPVAVADIDYEPVEILEYLYTMGYSGGAHRLWVTEGLATGDGRCSTGAAPGDSGGPVFNSIGKLVGITRAIDAMYGGQLVWHHVYYAPLEGLEDWLAKTAAPASLVPMPRLP